jgi:hypothetical protein
VASVIVRWRGTNRIVLRLDEMVEGLGQHAFFPNMQGTPTAKQIGSVELVPGINVVDADFWQKWREQNKNGLFVTSGQVCEDPKPKQE